MKKIIFLATTLFSCVLISEKTPRVRKPSQDPIKNRTIRPGEVVYLSFPGPAVKGANLVCNGKTYIHHYDGQTLSAYISETYFTHFKPLKCTYNKKLVAKFNVKEKKFPEEELKVFRKKVVLSPQDQARVEREWKFLKKIYKKGIQRPLFEGSFEKPMNSFITSIYGTRRTFNNIRKSQHLGTDFRAKVGTPVKASNSGKVVVARDLFYSGKTVIIDHGMGIFTVYGHLSDLNVAENSIINKRRTGRTQRKNRPYHRPPSALGSQSQRKLCGWPLSGQHRNRLRFQRIRQVLWGNVKL